MTQILHQKGALATAEIDQITLEEATKWHPLAFVLWGGNARSRAERLRNLGWRPEAKSVWDVMGEIADDEIKRFEEARY